MASLRGLHLLLVVLSHTFIPPSIMSHSHAVCLCVLMHLRMDFFFYYLFLCFYPLSLCVGVCVCVCRVVVIMLKWLEPSSGAVCLITVEQKPLISYCSPICLLQMSNLHTHTSIIFIFQTNTGAVCVCPAMGRMLMCNTHICPKQHFSYTKFITEPL